MAKKIVLSGCTRGLGRALADEFARLGHTVFGCGRDCKAIAQLHDKWGTPNQFDEVDITNEEAVFGWAGRILEECGPPDLLINNAAVIHRNANVWEVPLDEFRQVFDVNVISLHRLLRAFVPAMVERRHGIIVNLSSGAGRTPFPQIGPYCASKFAVEGLTKALAQELPPGMAAIPLSPGVVNTDMLRSNWGERAAACQDPKTWAHRAVPFILNLRAVDNGQSLTTPSNCCGVV
jgi:NAD(P)-dependent dehydrogenase (short-subunit alcohol dehydrogenase family)